MSKFQEKQLMDPCHDYAARQWEAARDEAKNLAAYASNWDGADADSVRPELIEATLRLLRYAERQGLPAPLYVYPTADGTVMVEWHSGHGFATVVNVRVPDRIEVIYRQAGVLPEFEVIPLPPDTLPTGERHPDDPPSYLDDDCYSLAA